MIDAEPDDVLAAFVSALGGEIPAKRGGDDCFLRQESYNPFKRWHVCVCSSFHLIGIHPVGKVEKGGTGCFCAYASVGSDWNRLPGFEV